jgi:hypothetical protein
MGIETMSEEGVSVRRLAWKELCPWLAIFRCFRLAISLPVLFLATIGVILNKAGWELDQRLFTPSTEVEAIPLTVADVAGSAPAADARETTLLGHAARRIRLNVVNVYLEYVQPYWRMFQREAPVRDVAYYLFGAIWTVLVWSFFAGAITRIAVVQLGRDERVGLRDAARHAVRNYGWYVLAPFFPLLGVVFAALPIVVVGWIMCAGSIGVAIGGVLWFLVLLDAILMTVLLLGLLLGWPLMWPTISSEASGDAFEAFSRSYAYTFQRPLHYLFYAFVAVLFGALCGVLVTAFAGAIVETSYWAAAWGAGAKRVGEIISAPSERGNMFFYACVVYYLWNQLVQAIASAFNFSFFWCTAAAVYLLLRRDVDQTNFDEVFVEGEEDRYQLPQTKTDETAGGGTGSIDAAQPEPTAAPPAPEGSAPDTPPPSAPSDGGS